MGSITRKFANNFLSGGTFAAAAINNASLDNVTDVPTAVKGKLTLISTQTASASASISFTSGIDSTYDEYIFKFFNIHPSSDGVKFTFNLSSDGGSNYNVTKTTTFFTTTHDEANTTTALGYQTGGDLAQSTGYSRIGESVGNGNDESLSGELILYQPSSTTYVKNYLSRTNIYYSSDWSIDNFGAGYANTTSAINAIDFQFASGNIDDGIFKMYGVSKT